MARKRLQTAVNQLERWAPSVGFEFSPAKSNLLHLGPNRKKLGKLPPLTLNDSNIPLVHSLRLLGIWIDDKLNFKCHMNKIRKNSTNKINILRILTNKTSFAHRTSLFRFLHGWLIPSVLYGIGFVSRTMDEVIRRLEPIYNECVRIISSAFCTSPIPSLMAESGQLPLKFLDGKNVSSKALRSLANGGSISSPMVQRTNSFILQLTGEPLPLVCPRSGPSLRHWNDRAPKVDMSLKQQIKAGDSSLIILPCFRKLVMDKFPESTQIYTDGSKTNNGHVGCGIYDGLSNRSLPLPNSCSVFSAEAYAMLDAIRNSKPNTVIFSDSASVLAALDAGNLKHPWIQNISELASQQNDITLCWVPGHSGIPGNEAADKLASAGTTMVPSLTPIPQQDATRFVKSKIMLAWDTEWSSNNHAKLREIKNTTESWLDRPCRVERTALTRLRIGHSRLTHVHLISKDDSPTCPSCQTPITIKHILTSCLIYQHLRSSCSLSPSLRQILSNCPEEEKKLIQFLKKSKLLTEI